MRRSFHNHDVTPAQAGAYHEMMQLSEISRWIPACAGMTPVVLGPALP